MDQEQIIEELTAILNEYRILYPERRQKVFCRYLTRKAQKKLLFNINPSKKGVMFGIHHHGTDILEILPTIKLLADENKQCVTKILIENPEDIAKKGIKFLIETCIDIAGRTFYNYEKFSREKVKHIKTSET